MEQEDKDLEKTFIGKFQLDDHPLFRSKEDSEKLIYNKTTFPIGVKETNEQRIVQGQQSQFGGIQIPMG